MSEKVTVRNLADFILEVADGRDILLYTGRDTNRRCAVHIGTHLSAPNDSSYRNWVYWNGEDADSEPPIYVPHNVDIDGLCQVCTAMGGDLVSGVTELQDVPNTLGIFRIDTNCSNDKAILVFIDSEYESFLDSEEV